MEEASGLLFLEEEEEAPQVPKLFDYCLASVARNVWYYHEHPQSSIPEDIKVQLYNYLDGTASNLNSYSSERCTVSDVVLSVFMPEEQSIQDLSENPDITDFGLFLIPSSVASQLTHLFLNDCFNISDNGLAIVASKCPQLKTLALSGFVQSDWLTLTQL